jgi:hypothetical protein
MTSTKAREQALPFRLVCRRLQNWQQLGKSMRIWILISPFVLALASPALADIGRVKSATGGAFIERDGKIIAAQPGIIVMTGDTLVTGPKGKMGLTFIDNTRLSAGPASRMKIKSFDYNDTTYRGRFASDLTKGTVALVAGRIARTDPSAMRVQTGKHTYLIRSGRVVIKAGAQ